MVCHGERDTVSTDAKLDETNVSVSIDMAKARAVAVGVTYLQGPDGHYSKRTLNGSWSAPARGEWSSLSVPLQCQSR